MKIQKHVHVQALLCGMLVAFGITASTAMAAETATPQKSAQATKPPAPPAPTKEQRETMAKGHEKMAACLRTERAMSDCQQEARKACQDAGSACMMGSDHMKSGMGGGHMDGQQHGNMQQGMPMNNMPMNTTPSTPPAEKK